MSIVTIVRPYKKDAGALYRVIFLRVFSVFRVLLFLCGAEQE